MTWMFGNFDQQSAKNILWWCYFR